MIEDEADMAVLGTKQEISARKRSMVNMWLIVGSIGLVVSYNSIYSLVLYFGSVNQDVCYVFKNKYVQSWTIAISRSMQYTLWYYPIIWLFWPPAPSFCRKNQKKVIYRHESEEVVDESDDESASEEGDKHSYLSNANLDRNTGSVMFLGTTQPA